MLLTDIGRRLQSEVKLKEIEERFCRQLDKPDLWPAIHEQVPSDADPRLTEESLLILDLSDITKEYAERNHIEGRIGNSKPSPLIKLKPNSAKPLKFGFPLPFLL